MDRLRLIRHLMEVMTEKGVHQLMVGQILHMVEMALDRLEEAEGLEVHEAVSDMTKLLHEPEEAEG